MVNGMPCICICPAKNKRIPAGMATTTALLKTKSVRSKKERIRTFPNCGLRYGGNSNVKAEGTPFKRVMDNR